MCSASSYFAVRERVDGLVFQPSSVHVIAAGLSLILPFGLSLYCAVKTGLLCNGLVMSLQMELKAIFILHCIGLMPSRCPLAHFELVNVIIFLLRRARSHVSRKRSTNIF